MSVLSLEIRGYAFSELPQFGPEHVLSKVAEGTLAEAGMPVLQPEDRTVSGSGLVKPREALELAARINPGQEPPLPDTCFVVTGQQAGLLTGPIYTFLKTITAIDLARRLEEEWSRPVRPLFWIASEDHDVLEVNRITINGRKFVWEYEGALKRGEVPQVADIPLEDARGPLLGFLDEALRDTDFKPWIMGMVEKADFSNYQTFFESLMRTLFGGWGLWFADPISLRPLLGRALADCVEKLPVVVEAFKRGTEHVREAGFEPPVASLGLFEIVDGKRKPLEFDDKGVTLSSGQRSFSEAAEEIHRRPEAFSPGAALRPVVQDAALPVAVTVGGPSELLYLWQADPVYSVMGFRRSRVHPRISCTYVEKRIRDAAEKAGLWPGDIFLVRERLRELPREVEDPDIDAIEAKANELTAELSKLKVTPQTQWLPKKIDSLASSAEYILKRLRKAKAEEMGLGKQRLEKIAGALVPAGRPQERVMNIFEFLNLYGPDFVKQSVEALDSRATSHQAAVIHAD